jgi:hypothetical protein
MEKRIYNSNNFIEIIGINDFYQRSLIQQFIPLGEHAVKAVCIEA